MAALDVRARLALAPHLDSGLKAREVKAWAGVAPSDGVPGCRFGKFSSPERAKPCSALSGLTHSRVDLPGASLADSLHPRLSHRGLSALSAVGPAPISPGPDSIPPKTAKNRFFYRLTHGPRTAGRQQRRRQLHDGGRRVGRAGPPGERHRRVWPFFQAAPRNHACLGAGRAARAVKFSPRPTRESSRAASARWARRRGLGDWS